jgi:undecaprenyl-diphosphatase
MVMPEIFQVIILAIAQGLTEFLPVSSSAHLILVPKLFGWEDQGLFFDVAVHIGTLIAVVSYFRQDLSNIFYDWINSLRGGKTTVCSKLMWAVGFGTIPVGIAGLLTKNVMGSNFRSELIIAVTTIVFGILLAISSWLGKETRTLDSITWKDILYIGCAQAIALIPGTSRSGITLTAGLFRGFSRTDAARYSFLLSIPVILLAGGLELYKVYKEPLLQVIDWQAAGVGLIVSGITGYMSIHYFMRLLNKIGVMPFIVYRIFLGILLLWLFL